MSLGVLKLPKFENRVSRSVLGLRYKIYGMGWNGEHDTKYLIII